MSADRIAADRPDAAPFHLGNGWYDPWRAAYAGEQAMSEVAGLPVIAERARSGPFSFHRVRSQTNVHTPRLDLPGADRTPVPVDLPAWLLRAGPAGGRVDLATLDYVAEGSRLLAAARDWPRRHLTAIVPQAHAPAVDCRRSYAQWLGARSKRSRTRWIKLENEVIGRLGMSFSVLDGRDDLPALIEQILLVERSGWKGRAGTAIADSVTDTLFYSRLAEEAAAAGALRLAVLRHEGRIVAFEYGIVGDDRLFLLKVGYDETFERWSIGHVLANLNIRHCCADPAIAWYDKLGNGLTPAAYKLRFADTVDTLYRITVFDRGWRGRTLYAATHARQLAKRARDRWWATA